MDAKSIEFPLLCLDDDYVALYESEDILTRGTALALKRNAWTGMRLIDTQGRIHVITGAKKLRGVGLFRGYNIFFNQDIYVTLDYDLNVDHVSFDDVKTEVFRMAKKDHYLQSRGDYEELLSDLGKAKTFDELFYCLGDDYAHDIPFKDSDARSG